MTQTKWEIWDERRRKVKNPGPKNPALPYPKRKGSWHNVIGDRLSWVQLVLLVSFVSIILPDQFLTN